MFERYTEKARRVIFFAKYEASTLGSPYVEPEHLLLGMIREDKDFVAQLLPGKREALDQRIREGAEARERIATSVDLPLSRAARHCLAYAAEEAERMAHKNIGVPHLLMGLLREESRAKSILEDFGVNLDAARNAVLRGTTDPVQLFYALQSRFTPLTLRLRPENEPAFTFLP
ncbi:MAG TPA: Clp protease N-terminal domain-containing protein [Bryobacteraceae bacterium]|nr:Clp protease N-terminal domain-containing protein [Bryobacteraceae bacterium]